MGGGNTKFKLANEQRNAYPNKHKVPQDIYNSMMNKFIKVADVNGLIEFPTYLKATGFRSNTEQELFEMAQENNVITLKSFLTIIGVKYGDTPNNRLAALFELCCPQNEATQQEMYRVFTFLVHQKWLIMNPGKVLPPLTNDEKSIIEGIVDIIFKKFLVKPSLPESRTRNDIPEYVEGDNNEMQIVEFGEVKLNDSGLNDPELIARPARFSERRTNRMPCVLPTSAKPNKSSVLNEESFLQVLSQYPEIVSLLFSQTQRK